MKKDLMCLLSVNNTKGLKKWLGAVGECGMATVPGVPVMQSFYKCLLRNGVRSSKRFQNYVFKNTSMLERKTTGDDTITDESRASFAFACGISPEFQHELERYYDSLVLDMTHIKVDGSSVCEEACLPMFTHLADALAL
jgi:hypothetical protein